MGQNFFSQIFVHQYNDNAAEGLGEKTKCGQEITSSAALKSSDKNYLNIDRMTTGAY